MRKLFGDEGPVECLLTVALEDAIPEDVPLQLLFEVRDVQLRIDLI